MERLTPNSLYETEGSSDLSSDPRKSDTFILTTDSSEVGLGAVQSTSRGTVVEYASQTLTAAEKSYCTSEKQCLPIVWATQKLRHYLIGACFTLETDHKPLEWLQSAKKSNAHTQCLERWSLELRAFVVHHPGQCNKHADALSWIPVSTVTLQPPICMADLSTTLQNDPILSVVHRQLQNGHTLPSTGNWNKFPLKCYRKL